MAERLSGEQHDRDNGQGEAGKASGNAKRKRKSGDRGNNNEGGDNNNGVRNEDGAPQGARVHGHMCGLNVANELDGLDFLQRGRTGRMIQTPHPALSFSGDLLYSS
eukprot:scaffold192934_cov33-Attheya_sp.AAC.1